MPPWTWLCLFCSGGLHHCLTAHGVPEMEPHTTQPRTEELLHSEGSMKINSGSRDQPARSPRHPEAVRPLRHWTRDWSGRLETVLCRKQAAGAADTGIRDPQHGAVSSKQSTCVRGTGSRRRGLRYPHHQWPAEGLHASRTRSSGSDVLAPVERALAKGHTGCHRTWSPGELCAHRKGQQDCGRDVRFWWSPERRASSPGERNAAGTRVTTWFPKRESLSCPLRLSNVQEPRPEKVVQEFRPLGRQGWSAGSPWIPSTETRGGDGGVGRPEDEQRTKEVTRAGRSPGSSHGPAPLAVTPLLQDPPPEDGPLGAMAELLAVHECRHGAAERACWARHGHATQMAPKRASAAGRAAREPRAPGRTLTTCHTVPLKPRSPRAAQWGGEAGSRETDAPVPLGLWGSSHTWLHSGHPPPPRPRRDIPRAALSFELLLHWVLSLFFLVCLPPETVNVMIEAFVSISSPCIPTIYHNASEAWHFLGTQKYRLMNH